MMLIGMSLLATLPATSNYQLNSYGFGSGGTGGSGTATYSLEGQSGDLSAPDSTASGSQYKTKPGFIQTQQANVPKIASLDNGSGLYYNKLNFVLDPQGNPSDATFLIAVSTDNFVSDDKYLQPDGTLSPTLTPSDYQTYADWGSSSGSSIIGLLPGTTYYVRARATQGLYSESAFGPSASQATANPTLTFALTTTSESSPPFSVNIGTLEDGVVTSAPDDINVSLSTNGASGGDIYVSGKNGGLLSGSTGFKIASSSTDLATASDGFGAWSSSASQASGGPFTALSHYAAGSCSGSSCDVGIIGTIMRSLYTTGGPVSGGSGTLSLSAKASRTDVAASDYQEVLTFVAAANF